MLDCMSTKIIIEWEYDRKIKSKIKSFENRKLKNFRAKIKVDVFILFSPIQAI
jgi:hypothetical protein